MRNFINELSKARIEPEASIERSACGYVEQPLRNSKINKENIKIVFTHISREYNIKCINIQKVEIRSSEEKSVLIEDYSIRFATDLVTNKIEATIEIKDKGLEMLRHLEIEKLYFILEISIPSKTGSSPLIYPETLRKCSGIVKNKS